MRRAFTLIELLVVIAIIAILAAILFPVFAQAKVAAKKTASLSNAKQLTLGSLMYSGDTDDTLMPSAVWNSGNDPIKFDGGTGCSPWSWLILPYVKSADILDDPLGPPTPKLGTNISLTVSRAFFPEYGYNYSVLSPNFEQADGSIKQTPVASTAAGQPADTVFLVSKYGSSETHPTKSAYWSLGDGAALWATTEAPDCAYLTEQLCGSNWGKNDGFINSTDYMGISDVAAGANTGGNSIRANDSAVVAFLDGHAKSMKASALAAGTNWNPNIESVNTKVIDASKYLWDLQ